MIARALLTTVATVVVTETARVAEATMVVTLVVMEVEAARVVMETARVAEPEQAMMVVGR